VVRLCRCIALATGLVTTIAGSHRGYANGRGVDARFDSPRGITLDSDGHLVIADFGNHALRMIEPGLYCCAVLCCVVLNVCSSDVGFGCVSELVEPLTEEEQKREAAAAAKREAAKSSCRVCLPPTASAAAPSAVTGSGSAAAGAKPTTSTGGCVLM
jgi:hypothetical protein